MIIQKAFSPRLAASYHTPSRNPAPAGAQLISLSYQGHEKVQRRRARRSIPSVRVNKKVARTASLPLYSRALSVEKILHLHSSRYLPLSLLLALTYYTEEKKSAREAQKKEDDGVVHAHARLYQRAALIKKSDERDTRIIVAITLAVSVRCPCVTLALVVAL